MTTNTTAELASFHEFVARQIATGGGALSPEEALALWREREETVVAVHEGLAAVEEGRTKPLKAFAEDFRSRHGLAKDV